MFAHGFDRAYLNSMSSICPTLYSGKDKWIPALVTRNSDGVLDLNCKKDVPMSHVRLPDQRGAPTMTSAPVTVEGASAHCLGAVGEGLPAHSLAMARVGAITPYSARL